MFYWIIVDANNPALTPLEPPVTRKFLSVTIYRNGHYLNSVVADVIWAEEFSLGPAQTWWREFHVGGPDLAWWSEGAGRGRLRRMIWSWWCRRGRGGTNPRMILSISRYRILLSEELNMNYFIDWSNTWYYKFLLSTDNSLFSVRSNATYSIKLCWLWRLKSRTCTWPVLIVIGQNAKQRWHWKSILI